MRHFKLLTIFLFLIVPIVSAVAKSSIRISTYAEGNAQLYPDDNDKWHLNAGSQGWNPKNMFELKFDIKPMDDFAVWYKTSATTASNDRNKSLKFTFYDLNLRYQKNLGGGQGFEAVTFMREDSRFWIDQPLLRFTDNGGSWGVGDDRGDKGSMNGLYFNSWNILGLNMLRAYLVGPGIGGADERKLSGALRIRKDFLKGGIKIGATGAYYREAVPSKEPKVWKAGALDFDTNLLGPFQFAIEAGVCGAPEENIPKNANAQWTYKSELRGNFSLGEYGQTGFLLSLYYATEKFQNWRGNGSDGFKENRFVERVEVYYNFPLKAIYLKEVLFYSHPVAGWASDNFHLWNYSNPNSLDATLESYTELYIEFKYGFKFKSYLKQTDGKEYVNDGRLGVWRSLFFQFEVENAFARIKPQALFLNINDPDSAAASYGAEVLINLSDQIKFYTRFAMVAGSQNDLYRSEEGDRNWYTFAAELQFLKIFSNTEMFVSFGNFDHTNDDLVHDKNGGILNGRVMEKKLNFFIKFWM